MKDSIEGLKRTPSVRDAFKNKKLISAKRKAPNIKRLVTRAVFKGTSTAEVYSTRKCKANCITCQYLVESSEVKFNNSDKPFQIRHNFTCNSKNLIYLIVCSCGLTYIGECVSLKQRLFLHRSNLKNEHNRILPVSKHIFDCSGGRFKLYPFYKMQTENEQERKSKEAYFIRKYKPELNNT